MSKEPKKYYWLKLKNDFFEDDTIAFIEEQNREYALFYLKLCLKSLKTEGKLIRLVGETLIPYDANALAKLTNTDVDTVRCAMALFREIGLVKILESGEIYISQIKEMIGTETAWAEQKRRQRVLDNNADNVRTMSAKCADNVHQMSTKCPPDIDIEKDIEKEIETEIEVLPKGNRPSAVGRIVNNNSSFGDSSINEMFDEWERIFGYQQKNTSQNRRACYNMLRSKGKGKEWLMQMMRISFEAGSDRYAGKAVNGNKNFSDIQKNYEAILLWARRKHEENLNNLEDEI